MNTLAIPRTVRFAVAASACVLALGGLSACGDDTESDTAGQATTTTAAAESQDVSVLDGTYTSTSVTGYTLVPGSTITLEFSGVQLSYNAGCNHMSGNYTIEENVLKLTGDASSTMMACDQALMDQDTWLTSFLTGGATVSNAEGSALTLTSGDVVIEFAQGTTAEGEELNGQEPGGTPTNGY